MKKCAVINDLSGFGKCSLTAAIPIMSAMGVEVHPLLTAVLSNQTAYESFKSLSLTDTMKPVIEEWKKLGAKFDGILIKGGVEGIQMKPEKANQQLFDQMKQLGETYAQKGIMDTALISEYKKEEQLSKFVQILFTILRPTGLPNFYWDYNLKKNGAFKMRFAKPYIE